MPLPTKVCHVRPPRTTKCLECPSRSLASIPIHSWQPSKSAPISIIPSFLTLPREIYSLIAQHITFADILSISSCCHSLRATLKSPTFGREFLRYDARNLLVSIVQRVPSGLSGIELGVQDVPSTNGDTISVFFLHHHRFSHGSDLYKIAIQPSGEFKLISESITPTSTCSSVSAPTACLPRSDGDQHQPSQVSQQRMPGSESPRHARIARHPNGNLTFNSSDSSCFPHHQEIIQQRVVTPRPPLVSPVQVTYCISAGQLSQAKTSPFACTFSNRTLALQNPLLPAQGAHLPRMGPTARIETISHSGPLSFQVAVYRNGSLQPVSYGAQIERFFGLSRPASDQKSRASQPPSIRASVNQNDLGSIPIEITGEKSELSSSSSDSSRWRHWSSIQSISEAIASKEAIPMRTDVPAGIAFIMWLPRHFVQSPIQDSVAPPLPPAAPITPNMIPPTLAYVESVDFIGVTYSPLPFF
ncbi:hypothetical protein DFS34DRAFT_129835 [Phlyctochytrium arcticum]|nr:hypothetical protein DFS34DRAFT_129835 [Phlyctochytrium arcticum]